MHATEDCFAQNTSKRKPRERASTIAAVRARMQIITICFLSLFVVTLSFADIIPPNKKAIVTTLKVNGLDRAGRTQDGRILVFVVNSTQGKRTVIQVLNNIPIDKGHKFNDAKLYFVSSKLLQLVDYDLEAIDYTKKQEGLTVAPIKFPSIQLANRNSPVESRIIIYHVR